MIGGVYSYKICPIQKEGGRNSHTLETYGGTLEESKKANQAKIRENPSAQRQVFSFLEPS